MSRDALAQIVERACTDAAFRAALQNSPDSALAGYDLTAEERAALLHPESGAVQALGVEPRVSKFDIRQEQDNAVDWLRGMAP